MQKGFIKELLRKEQTVFSFKEIMLLWPEVDPATIKSRLHYYVKQGDLYSIRRGLYAKDKHYNRFEVATKIYTPAYISFETVLLKAGMIFQTYNQIFVASYLSRSIICDNQEYVFRKLKSVLLTNSLGIKQKNTYSIATPERAFLDMLYIHTDYYVDNLNPLDWRLVDQLVPIYNNKRMEKLVDFYKKEAHAQ